MGLFGLRVKLPPAHLSTTVYCNKLRPNEMHNLQKHTNNSRLHPKMIGF